jgi:hypothetical protein
MLQHHLDLSVSRRTGESLQTIQQRGFSLLRMKPNRQTPLNGRRSSTSATPLVRMSRSTDDDHNS